MSAAGTPATIFAFAINPADNSLVAQATVSVTLGVAPTATISTQPTGVPTTPTTPAPFPTETPPPQPTVTPVPTNAPTPAPIPPEASNFLWILSQINGQVPVAGSLVTLQFQGYTVNGFAGCNTYSASVQYNNPSMTFTNVASGRKTCSSPAGVMQQESAYLNTLSLVKSFRLQQGQLLLLDQSGNLLLGYQAAVIGRIYGPDGAVIPARKPGVDHHHQYDHRSCPWESAAVQSPRFSQFHLQWRIIPSMWTRTSLMPFR